MKTTREYKEKISLWDLWKKHPEVDRVTAVGRDGYCLQRVDAHIDKMERYEITTYYHEEDGEEWTETVVYAYYNKQQGRQYE